MLTEYFSHAGGMPEEHCGKTNEEILSNTEQFAGIMKGRLQEASLMKN